MRRCYQGWSRWTLRVWPYVYSNDYVPNSLPSSFLRKHYKEYLVGKMNQANLDPLPLYEQEESIPRILRREEKPVPEREEGESDYHYKQRLIQVRQSLVSPAWAATYNSLHIILPTSYSM